MHYDYIIIGGGIVGVSTAWQLQQHLPNKRILLLEKEADFAKHQTGHNSGVIHAGVYYAPDSLKAKFCREGAAETISFCDKHAISYDKCGKLLVATNEIEYQRMQALFTRCQSNQLEVEYLDADALKQREPNITGVGAILVKSTGIVNYQQVTQKMAQCFTGLGGEAWLNSEVIGLQEQHDTVNIKLKTAQGMVNLTAGFVITCSGLMADRITKMMGIQTDFQIIPFRGEYYQLPAKYHQLVQHLIYPIPDPALPFLGIHLTRMIDGSITVGPNAVQGWEREGYGKWNFSIKDTVEMLSFGGFWKVLQTHWRTGLIETRNAWWKTGYLRAVQKYCPQLTLDDLQPYPAGIRAQAVLKDGTLVHDFLFAKSKRSLHVCNAPSPAATSAIPIGRYIVEKVVDSEHEPRSN